MLPYKPAGLPNRVCMDKIGSRPVLVCKWTISGVGIKTVKVLRLVHSYVWMIWTMSVHTQISQSCTTPWWVTVGNVHVGAKKVFWGVTEFHHLVDIVNQTDLVENIDAEDKLGQPMLQLSMVGGWGLVDAYVLVGFRERTFPGEDGRVRLPLHISNHASYESGARDHRVDAALRWSHNVGAVEFGLHHFSGTSRAPQFMSRLLGNGQVELMPYYPVIDQSGIDAQTFVGDWAFKVEAISRSGYGPRYSAANLGVEKTFFGAFGSQADIGLVLEYMWDERQAKATNTLFENDVVLGGRFQFNNYADTQILFGVVADRKSDDYFVSLEGSHRIAQSWLFSVEGRLFSGGKGINANTLPAVLLSQEYRTAWLQEDDYLQIEIKKFL